MPNCRKPVTHGPNYPAVQNPDELAGDLNDFNQGKESEHVSELQEELDRQSGAVRAKRPYHHHEDTVTGKKAIAVPGVKRKYARRKPLKERGLNHAQVGAGSTVPEPAPALLPALEHCNFCPTCGARLRP